MKPRAVAVAGRAWCFEAQQHCRGEGSRGRGAVAEGGAVCPGVRENKMEEVLFRLQKQESRPLICF